jgi:fatty acid desaturase
VRRWIDIRMLVTVAATYLLALAAWTRAPFEAQYVAPLVALLATAAWLCAVVAHNALHHPVFRSRRANDVFQLALTCAYGFPVSEYVPGHNLSHHRHAQKRADLMRTTKAPFVRLNALNLVYFFPRVALDVMVQNHRYLAAMAKKLPVWRRQLVVEAVACWGMRIGLLALDWRRALVFVVLPHLWALYAITTVNLLQHDGCDEDHPVNHSRNFTGRLFNWFTFNNGFHGVHHAEPTLHWSLLPAAHAARFHGRVHAALEQPSLFVWFVRTYVLSAQRRRYDGTTIAAIAVAPDEDWIAKRLGPEVA